MRTYFYKFFSTLLYRFKCIYCTVPALSGTLPLHLKLFQGQSQACKLPLQPGEQEKLAGGKVRDLGEGVGNQLDVFFLPRDSEKAVHSCYDTTERMCRQQTEQSRNS